MSPGVGGFPRAPESARRFGPPLAADGAPVPASPGFTLIELMIVTVMLGILAMIAMPIYRDLRGDAARAALQQQLRTLAQAQQMHFLEHDVYTDDGARLDYRPAADLQLEIRVAGTGSGSPDGWSARLTDTGHDVRCAVFYGDATPFEPAVVEGEIACDDEG